MCGELQKEIVDFAMLPFMQYESEGTIKLFELLGPEFNRYNAQLICNSHNVLLLEEEIRRDQICFVDKNIYDESELYSLTDFRNVRKNDSTLKKYLLGVYGAIPFKKGS